MEDELGTDLLREYVFVANIPYRIIPKFLESNSNFFDDVRTSTVETRDDIIRKSLVDALDSLRKEFGNSMQTWQWGDVHKVTFKHMFSGVSGLVDDLVNIGPYSIGGDGTTVFNTEYSFERLFAKQGSSEKSIRSKPYENILGPSMRYVFDFANPDYMEMILPTGQSGNFMSSHYKDMTHQWLNGKYIKLPLTVDKFKSTSINEMTLIPK